MKDKFRIAKTVGGKAFFSKKTGRQVGDTYRMIGDVDSDGMRVVQQTDGSYCLLNKKRQPTGEACAYISQIINKDGKRDSRRSPGDLWGEWGMLDSFGKFHPYKDEPIKNVEKKEQPLEPSYAESEEEKTAREFDEAKEFDNALEKSLKEAALGGDIEKVLGIIKAVYVIYEINNFLYSTPLAVGIAQLGSEIQRGEFKIK